MEFILFSMRKSVKVCLLLCVAIYIGTVNAYRTNTIYNTELQMIKTWSEDISRSLVTFTETVTAYSDISWEYNQATSDNKVHGDTLVKNIAEDIRELLKEKLDAVLALAKEAEGIYQNYTYDVDLDIDYLNSKKLLSDQDASYITEFSNHEVVVEMAQQARTLDLTPDKKFNYEPVNHHNSTVHVPTNVYDRFPKILNGAYWTQGLDEQFKKNEQKDKSLRWQYFCSTDGFFRVYPGMKWPRDNENGIDIYDCRVRSWYLQAATCPKNVVILLDSSGSMKGSRMVIARSTVKKILNTLDDDDYFNIIKFSDKVEFVDSCFNKSMMPATTQNKRRLQEIVDQNVTASNTADFRRAFDEGFHLLNSRMRERRGSNLCNKAILLITDGVPEHYDSVFKWWTSNFKNITTRVFTFLIGREVDDDREVRWMACANKGYYSHISTLADVQENVQNYIKVMSRQMVIDRYRNTIWTSVYLDHMSYLDSVDLNKGLQFMTSVAVPVFDTKRDTVFEGNLLGVMGTDIPIELIKGRIPFHQIGSNGYAFMINHNGYVLMHPDYRPFKKITKTKELLLHPYYKNVDLTDVALPVEKNQFLELVRGMLSEHEKFGSQEVELMSHYENMKRMVKRRYNIHRCKVEGTDFSIGIALPSTSLRLMVSAYSLPSLLDDYLIGPDIELAPWYYCNDLDPSLTGKDRIEALTNLFKQDTNNCKNDLLAILGHDSLRLNKTKIRQKWGQEIQNSNEEKGHDYRLINKSLQRNGIELVFIGTNSGLTKYASVNDSTPEFILNNTNTIEAIYFKRAVEGIEGIGDQPTYTYTFSVPLGKAFNPNETLVTVSAPIIKKNSEQRIPTIFAVVGMQMEYKTFANKLKASTQKNLECPGQFCSCGNGTDCYLVDNHGYITARIPETGDDKIGKFFGEAENGVMGALIKTKIFEEYSFTDYQDLCDVEASDRESSSASNLLNPIKSILNGLFWTITEIVVFISEFSLKSLFTNLNIVHAEEEAECGVIEDYDYDTLDPKERLSYNLMKMMCSTSDDGDKVVGHRPCQRSFKLYKANFRKLQKVPAHGYVPGCYRNYSGCQHPDCRGFEKDKTEICDDFDCEEIPVNKFGLVHKEVIKSEEAECAGRQRSKYVDTKFLCSEFFKNETLACGSAHALLSSWTLFSALVVPLVRYLISYS